MTLPGGFELVIIFVIVLLLFGVGRITKIAGELGSGIRAFKQGMKDSEKEAKAETEETEEKTKEKSE
jgi:sec-independent protein translocase protein TatA